MKQNTMIGWIIGVAFVTFITVLYGLTAFFGHAAVSASQWWSFVGVAMTLNLASFVPIILRRRSGLPEPKPLTPSDNRFLIALIVILLPVTFFACWTWGPFGSMTIMLVPLAFMLRSRQGVASIESDRIV